MLNIIDFQKEDYIKILKKQEDLFDKKTNGLRENFVLIGEHHSVYTCGKRTKKEHIYSNPENVPVINIERGGSITFHGEGQIVFYPIIDIRDFKLSVKDYIFTLEQILIDTCEYFNIKTFRKKGYPGVFTEEGKIGFLGVKVSKYITLHGASLNVNVDKKYFGYINPCGINTPVVNMSDYTDVPLDEVKDILKNQINLKFG